MRPAYHRSQAAGHGISAALRVRLERTILRERCRPVARRRYNGGRRVARGLAEEQMKHHWPIVAASVLALTTVDATLATAKHRYHAVRHVHAPVMVGHAPAFDPPRMIEVRPGVIISSWDCITDEGYGRWRPCGAGKR